MARKRGYRVAEVPVNWSHQPGSKVRLAEDSLIMAFDLFRIRANWLRGEYNVPHLSAWDLGKVEPATSLDIEGRAFVPEQVKDETLDSAGLTSLTALHPT